MSAPERIWIDGSVGGRYITASATPEDCMAPHGPYVCADLARPQWQPIETAPKDGTYVILARVYDFDGVIIKTVTFGNWSEGYGDGPDEMGVLDGWHDHHYSEFDPGRDFGNPAYFREPAQPTHWMPLPAPPEARTLSTLDL